MQFGVTWSPDVQFIAYSSDRGGKFDIWVQQVVAINPVKITSRAGHNWQPDWSPNSNEIVFRSEGADGGLFVVPSLGGPERRISAFGYRPRWSPDGLQILFESTSVPQVWNRLYLANLDGSAPREILSDQLRKLQIAERSVGWLPDAKHISETGFHRPDRTNPYLGISVRCHDWPLLAEWAAGDSGGSGRVDARSLA